MVHSYQYCEPPDTRTSSNPATGQQLKSSESLPAEISSSTKSLGPQDLSPNKENLLESIPTNYSIEDTKEELFLVFPLDTI